MANRKYPSQAVRHDGDLCATFVNSGNARRKSISSYAELLAWGQRHGALGDADAQRLARAAEARPANVEAVALRARETRALLERILLALAERRTLADADMEAFNEGLGAAMANRRMAPAGSGYRWGWGDHGGDDLDRVLWHVLLSAAEVLASKVHRKVYRCPGEGCGLFLVDRSPGKARKSCRRCGQRARSHKHYHAKVKPARARIAAGISAERFRRTEERRRQRLEASRGEDEADSPPAVPKRTIRQVF